MNRASPLFIEQFPTPSKASSFSLAFLEMFEPEKKLIQPKFVSAPNSHLGIRKIYISKPKHIAALNGKKIQNIAATNRRAQIG